MGNRPVCPKCGSTSALGTVICFKCSYRQEYSSIPGIFTELRDKAKQIIELDKNIVFNPRHFSVEALKWLYQYSIYDELIIKHSIGYWPSRNKIVLPYFSEYDGKLMYYQLRALNPYEPRYITEGNKTKSLSVYRTFPNSRELVIVEDRISAIRVSRFANCVTLLTTSMDKDSIDEVLNDYITIILWLDPDEAGTKATFNLYKRFFDMSQRKFTATLWLNGSKTINTFYKIDSNKVTLDPKWYLDCEIENILNKYKVSL